MTFLQKLKTELPYECGNSTSGHLSKGNKKLTWKDMHPHTHCSIIYNSQNMEVSFSVCPDKKMRYTQSNNVKVLVLSNSLWPHGLYSPWNSPDQNSGVGSLSLFQESFPRRAIIFSLNKRRVSCHCGNMHGPWGHCALNEISRRKTNIIYFHLFMKFKEEKNNTKHIDGPPWWLRW